MRRRTRDRRWAAQRLEWTGATSKIERLAGALVCPHCRGELRDRCSRCSRCGRVYGHGANHYNFLTAEHRRELSIESTENVAANEYDTIAAGIIGANPDGLILDCGAGSHATHYSNVVCYEVAPYPSTDVLGVGEHLPFRDDTFDAVFSLNVLEHVADPFSCASELSRVLKRDGILYCVVPFLQPVHGYPNHFYNMTAQGLRRLFDKTFEIVQHDVPLSGVPIWTLHAFLRSWAAGLPEDTRATFMKMRVEDLIAEPVEQFLAQDFVSRLTREKNFELASTTMILARKN